MARWAVWDGPVPGQVKDPEAGGHVETIQREGYWWSNITHIGRAIPIQAGASVSAGDDLATDGSGHCVPATSGDVIVARALQSGSANDEVWVAMTNQAETA